MELDQVGDDGDQAAPAASALDGLPGDVVEEGVDGEDQVRVVIAKGLVDDAANPTAEDAPDQRECGPVVEPVVDGAPDRRRPLDDRRVKAGQLTDQRGRGIKAEQRVEAGDPDLGIQLQERLLEGLGSGAVATTGVREQDQD